MNDLFADTVTDEKIGAILARMRNKTATRPVEPVDADREWLQRMLQRGRTEMFSVTIDLTPELAKLLLTLNLRNRPLKPAEVKKYEKIIREGRWIFMSQGISINWEGVLNNGQHRLTAVVNTGITVRMYVTFGEDPEAFKGTDTQRTRTGGDTLALVGEHYTNTLSAALKLLHNIERKAPRSNSALSNDMVEDYLKEAHPMLREAAPQGSRANHQVKCSQSGATVAYYLIMIHSRFANRLDDFWDKLCHGVGILDPKDPILTYRNRLLNKGGGSKLEVAASIILCWNAWVSRKRSHCLWTADEFPQVL